jgi:hypothetical protein
VNGTHDAKPTRKQFEDSYDQFRAVLEELRPERVLVCGFGRLWTNMPSTPSDNGLHRIRHHDRVQAYELADGTPVWGLAMGHPSRDLRWKKWHEFIVAFLDNPGTAVPILLINFPRKVRIPGSVARHPTAS